MHQEVAHSKICLLLFILTLYLLQAHFPRGHRKNLFKVPDNPALYLLPADGSAEEFLQRCYAAVGKTAGNNEGIVAEVRVDIEGEAVHGGPA